MISELPFHYEKFTALKKELKPYEYKVLEEEAKRVLVINTPNAYPDLVNDLESAVEKINERDAQNLTHVCIIGEREALGVEPKLLEALLLKRKKYDDLIVARIRKKLTADFTNLTFKAEDDVHKLQRCAFKIPGDANSYKDYLYELGELPENVSIVYLVGDNNYVRISAARFSKQLASKEQVIERFKQKVLDEGYELVSLENVTVDLAAQKGDSRIVLKYCESINLEDAKAIEEEAERLRVSVCFVLVNKFSKEVKKFALGKKIELVEVSELGELGL